MRLGLRQTRHLVLVLALRSRVLRAPGHDAEVSDLWAHALGASLCAQSLAALQGLSLMRLISPQHRPRYRNEIAALEKFAKDLIAPARYGTQ